MTDCRGEPCKVTKYEFAWKDVLITGVTTHSRPVGEPPKSTAKKLELPEDTSGRKAFKDAALSGVKNKAVDQQNEEKGGRHLRKRIDVNGDSVTLVDATCGADGECYCDEKGPETAGDPIEITVSFSDLTVGRDTFHSDDSYDVEIVVKATPKTSPGLCFATKHAF